MFTVAPLYAAEVIVQNTSILRLFEWDREMHRTFQVDLCAEDADTNRDGVEAFYAHVKLRNPNAHTVDGYCWTDIGQY